MGDGGRFLQEVTFRRIDMKNDKTLRRILSAGLCFSIVIGSTGCKKKTKQEIKREVLETDPYFDAQVHELKIPLNEARELDNLMIGDVQYLGDAVIMNYSVSYEFGNAIGSDGYIPDGFNASDYYMEATALFDIDGELISNGKLLNEYGGEVSSMTTDKDGNLVFYVRIINPPEGLPPEKIIYLDRSGNKQNEIIPEIQWESEKSFVGKIQVLSDGKTVLTVYAETGEEVHVFDETGKHMSQISEMDLRVTSDLFMKDGKYYAVTEPAFSSEGAGVYISEIDIGKGTITEKIELDDSMSLQSLVVGEDGIYSATPNGIDKINMETGKAEEILNWNQTDIDHSLVQSIRCYPKNENEFSCIATRYVGGAIDSVYYILQLKRAEKNPHAGETILYVGGMMIPDSFYEYVHRYNADTSHHLRIETQDYLYDSEALSQGVSSSIHLQMMDGTAPDLLLNFAGNSQIENEQTLLDLNVFIDGDNGLSRDEYFDNIFRAMERDGKLFSAPLSFGLSGYFVNPDLADVDSNWTFDDLDKVAESLPSSAILFPQTNCSELLEIFMGPDLSEYMDYDKKEVHFSSENMKRILEETKKYGITDGYAPIAMINSGGAYCEELKNVDGFYLSEEYKVEGMLDVSQLLYNGACAMIMTGISGVENYNDYKGLLRGRGKMVGYPSVDGKGIIATPHMSISIVQSTPYPEESWEIIKDFYSEDAQLQLGQKTDFAMYGFPMRRSAFDKLGEQEIERLNRAYDYYLSIKGRPEDYGMVFFEADKGLTDEVREIVEGVRYSTCADYGIWDIIVEETMGYFHDSRSAEEVLKNIDNRATQIIQER